MKIILQNNEQDCLLACYSMILYHYGREISVYDLYDKDMIPPDGLSVSYLKNLNVKNNISMKAFKISDKSAINLFDNFRFPVIVQWKKKHFVVVQKISKKKVTIIDPEIGRIKLTLEQFLNNFSNYVISLSPDEHFKEVKKKSLIYEPLKKTFINKNIFGYIVSILLAQAVALFFSIFIKNTLDQKYNLLVSIMLIIFLIIIQIVSFYIKQVSQQKTNILFEKEVSKKLFEGLLSRPILYFRNNTIGTIIEKINLKTGIRDSILFQLLPSILNFLSMFSLILYLGFISLYLTITLILLSLFYLGITTFLYVAKLQSNMNYLQKTIDLASTTQEDLSQIDQIKAQAIENKITKKWYKKSKETIEPYNHMLKIDSISSAFGQIYNYIGVIIIIIMGLYFNRLGIIKFSDLILFQSGIMMMFSVMLQIQNAAFEASRISIYSSKIEDLFTPSPLIQHFVDPSSEYSIVTNKISYSYDDKINVFNNVSISIKKGEKIAIVGDSGSGKSTLLHVLLGLYSYKGEITYGYKNFRKNLGVVLQNMTLREGTIIENLVDINDPIDFSRIKKVLKDTNIDMLIDSLPNKIYSNLFQNGKNLSGGQIQRLLIAKSLMQPDGIIFWDEAFSSLDNKNRTNIYNKVLINTNYKENTIILVSHHLDVLEYVDRIIFINNGSVYIDRHKNLCLSNRDYQEFLNISQVTYKR
uniref:LmgT-protease and ABC transporter cleavage of the leader peptide and export of mature lacticin LMG n=1 Tax=Lactococcus lactis subsp. lactis TaxID=1360 RepID=A0A0M7BIJ4_LACLL|nr:LmgT-protease and ABC transporter; cleavage of the leader peptide and export of mature lacticin LMG [Lactococcus lactis subsp. lactis]